ncbi:uncharacterized HTH-type transcriptional regulator YisV-like [Zophobas morio]|uniref:uncharacterized HTH-type transcriptional regulator YisV-like n=1 Tax=Zophobas morio TaxID=2755281 RepID=UPI003082BFEE
MPYTSAWRRAESSKKIDYAVGQPSKELLKNSLTLVESAFKNLCNEVALGKYDYRYILQYGDNAGNQDFLEELAKFLSFEYSLRVSPEHLFVTNGSSSGLELCCNILLGSNKLVFVEDPTYFLAMNTFKDHNATLVKVDTDENGLMIDNLILKITKYGKPAFLYVIPTFSNPTGATLSDSRRRELLAICSKNDIIIVSDDVYQLLWFEEKPPLPLVLYSNRHVVSLGSFSKILAPGLRLGWIQSHPSIIKKLCERGFIQSQGKSFFIIKVV